MFHVFAFTYYILLRCVTREYSMTSRHARVHHHIRFARGVISTFSSNLVKTVSNYPPINMFHVFAFTYYILLHCVTRKYSMTSVTTKNYSIYATREYTTIFDLHNAYYSLLERYMKHVFVAGLVTEDLLFFFYCNFLEKFTQNTQR